VLVLVPNFLSGIALNSAFFQGEEAYLASKRSVALIAQCSAYGRLGAAQRSHYFRIHSVFNYYLSHRFSYLYAEFSHLKIEAKISQFCDMTKHF
jgi:hypothetical protein